MIAAFGGSAYTIAAAPLLPWWAIAALAGIAVLVLAIGAWRRARGVFWRAAALAMLLTILVNPSLVEEKRAPLRDVAVIVLDESASQGIGERRAASERALAALRDRLGRERDLDVRIVRTGQNQPGSGDDGTRLFTALSRSLADVPRQRLAGIIMITDGQVHDVPGPAAEKAAGELGAPLHVLLSGHRDEHDRRLAIANAPSFGLVGKELPLTVRVEDLPAPADGKAADGDGGPEQRARITWRKDGGAPHPMMVPVGRDVTLSIPIDHGGPNVLEIEAEAGPQELTLANNRAAIVVNGVRDRLRVLLVSGEPHAGERVWRNILKSDPSVDLVHFTILRPPEKQDGTPIRELSLIAFPIRELFDVKLRRVRPDHLRPLQPARHHPAGLYRQCRALCAPRRRAARSGGSDLRHADDAVPHAARRDPADRADRRRARAGIPAAIDRARAAPSGHRRSARRRQAGRGAELGTLVPAGRGTRVTAAARS